MGCGCGGKRNSGPVNMRGQARGLSSNLKKSRQLPASTLRQLSVQKEVNASTKRAEQEKVRTIRQKMVREKFGH